MSLSIIIPCKNEEENIEQTIETICSYISEKIHDSTLPTEDQLQENIDSIMNPERDD